MLCHPPSPPPAPFCKGTKVSQAVLRRNRRNIARDEEEEEEEEEEGGRGGGGRDGSSGHACAALAEIVKR